MTGGKDSTVLAHMLTTLNDRYDYGLDLFLLSIDEGITGYRDDSLETVRLCGDPTGPVLWMHNTWLCMPCDPLPYSCYTL